MLYVSYPTAQLRKEKHPKWQPITMNCVPTSRNRRTTHSSSSSQRMLRTPAALCRSWTRLTGWTAQELRRRHGSQEALLDSPASFWNTFSAAFTHTNVPNITWAELLLSLAAAVVLSIPRRSWRYFGLLATATHELGHAFAALTSGQRLSGIRLRLDHSGTTTAYSRSRLAAAWSCFWGYPVPALAGAAFVWSGLNGWGPAAMAASAVVLTASLLFLRNLAGFVITGAAIAGTGALTFLAPPTAVGHAAVIFGLALLVA